MSNINQSSNRTKNRPWAAFFPVLLLAPLAMAPKGCNSVIIGDDCPDETPCAAGTAGTAGGVPTPSAGAAGKPTGSGGSAGKPTGSGGANGGGDCGGLLGLWHWRRRRS